jgi:hypothetical protein
MVHIVGKWGNEIGYATFKFTTSIFVGCYYNIVGL